MKGGNYPDVSSFTEANVGSMGIFAPLNFCLIAHECRFNEMKFNVAVLPISDCGHICLSTGCTGCIPTIAL